MEPQAKQLICLLLMVFSITKSSILNNIEISALKFALPLIDSGSHELKNESSGDVVLTQKPKHYRNEPRNLQLFRDPEDALIVANTQDTDRYLQVSRFLIHR